MRDESTRELLTMLATLTGSIAACAPRAARTPAAGPAIDSGFSPAAAAVAKILYCAGTTLATLPSPVGWRRNLLRGALHAGTLSGLAGARQAALYGDATGPHRIPQPTATAVN